MNNIGIDVDSQSLVCCVQRDGDSPINATFANSTSGHRQLIRWATKGGQTARVCMEATGVYSLPFALALDAQEAIQVMVVNPKAIKHFATAILQRGKTDQLDAKTILSYLLRMDFQPWHAPSEKALEIQHISRRISQLNDTLTRERNRLKAAQRLGQWSNPVCNDIEVQVRFIEKRIERLGALLLSTITADDELAPQRERLESVVGIGPKSGPRILAELTMMSPGLTGRQWVAYAGLDPRPYESGTSTNKPRRISKAGNGYLRDALYFPALVAIRYEPNVRAFYDQLIARGKKPLQGIVAVMRKLLLAIWGMFKNNEDWDGEKFYKIA